MLSIVKVILEILSFDDFGISDSLRNVSFSVLIYNTIIVSKGINIITGSNMSGKSAFMRTVGINA